MTKIEKFKEYVKTKRGLISKIYSQQKSRSRIKSIAQPSYSNKELQEWATNQEVFHSLFEKWKSSDYKKHLIPSIDRIDNNKGYSFDNIQIMTWAENEKNANIDMRSGKLIHGTRPQKAVVKFSKDNVFICEYVSIIEAYRQTNICFGTISNVCRGIGNTAGGYIWKFKG